MAGERSAPQRGGNAAEWVFLPVSWHASVKAITTLRRAIDTLVYRGDQWERGDDALALADATALLRSRIALVESDIFR
jgi:hypothetical protein